MAVVRLDQAGLIASLTLGRNRLLRANPSHPAAGALAQLLEVTFGPRVVIGEEFVIPGAEQVVIFGSWAARYAGEAGPPPHDIDVWWSARLTAPPLRRGGPRACPTRHRGQSRRPNHRTMEWPVRCARRSDQGIGAHHRVRRSRGDLLMARWTLGESDIEALLASGELQRLTGDAGNGERLLKKAVVTLETARSAIDRDPDSAFVVAYDAARQAVTALLAQQGLRPKTKGGHYAVERAVRAQFGQGFRQFGALRRRRNELEYPERPGDDASVGPQRPLATVGPSSLRPKV